MMNVGCLVVGSGRVRARDTEHNIFQRDVLMESDPMDGNALVILRRNLSR